MSESENTYDPCLPAFFMRELCRAYGPNAAQTIVDGSRRRHTTLRANTLRSSAEEVATVLDKAGIGWRKPAWYGDAFIVGEPEQGVQTQAQARDVWHMLQALSIYEEGKIYLQSLSSMLPALVLAPRPGADILDMCAAPGGKTTQLLALSAGQAHISACEMHAPRLEKLRFNLSRQGACAVNDKQTDARRLDDFFRFDQILLDAPCSGSGTLNAQDPKVSKYFSEELIRKSVTSQKALLRKALRLLKPQGVLVYSTCSVLPCENEDVLRSCLEELPVSYKYEISPIDVDHLHEGACAPTLLPTAIEAALCIAPDEYFEGFFMAKLIRRA